jgi:hypothetical protein
MFTRDPLDIRFKSPPVISVTSARCFPNFTSFSDRTHHVHPRSLRHHFKSPLCDLRDLCVMLSRLHVFLGQTPPCSRRPPLDIHPKFPSLWASVTSVRSFSRSVPFSHGTTVASFSVIENCIAGE